jgi:type I restriction enzyme M protein
MSTDESRRVFDITFIGAGPTGLFGAFYAGMRELSTKIIDVLPQPGGQLTVLYPSKIIYDTPGIPAIVARDLVTDLVKQASRWNPVMVLGEEARTLRRVPLPGGQPGEQGWLIESEKGKHYTRTVILTAGIGSFQPNRLDIESVNRFEGKGVDTMVPDPGAYAGKRVLIVGVFRGTVNRMINGYLLRDVLAKVEHINFASSEEIHTLSALYESMLKEMRDAAGDAGEFYTPRPVVRFIVKVLDPRLGDTILDPAAGTGGFLVEAFEHLKAQCRTVGDQEILQRHTLSGIEAKPLPYLLCQMNLLLHGVEYPQIDPGNALRFPLTEIGDRDRVDIIMTNPPFGGEEERGILSNFPEDRQTSETALLFLQLIMRKLRRAPKPGRAGLVVPNGTLFGDGVSARIKESLLRDFNLHTVVRLPNGVFAPYTPIPTNLLFFEHPGPSQDIWFYELPLPEGRKQYTKTKPLQFEAFAECLAWWENRQATERAWKVPAAEVLKYDEAGNLVSANLDLKNPNRGEDLEHLPPEEIAASILRKEQRILEIMAEIQALLAKPQT